MGSPGRPELACPLPSITLLQHLLEGIFLIFICQLQNAVRIVQKSDLLNTCICKRCTFTVPAGGELRRGLLLAFGRLLVTAGRNWRPSARCTDCVCPCYVQSNFLFPERIAAKQMKQLREKVAARTWGVSPAQRYKKKRRQRVMKRVKGHLAFLLYKGVGKRG